MPVAPGNHLRDVLRRHLWCTLAGLPPALELALARLDLVAQGSGPVVVLGGGRLVSLAREPPQVVLERTRVVVLRLHPQAHARARLVDQVDRLVGQEAVADVAVGELRGCNDRLVRDAHAVECLVAILQPAQDLDRLLHGWLAHQHRLEAPLQGRVALDVLAVLVEGGRADHVQLAARERGLEHVGGVHRALRSPGADDRVHLVDEEDQLVGGTADLVDHGLQPFLELAAVLRAGDHPGEVERDHAAVGQRLRHLVVDDALGDALDDRGLAHAGLAEQGRVVLRSPREDLDRLLDLVGAADHRVELALARLLGEVAAELLQPRRARLLTRSARVDAADDRAAQLRVRDTEPLQQLPRRRLFITREGEQHVLGADVGGTELARLLVGGQQRGLRVRGQRRGDVGPLRLLGLLLELRRDRGGVRADLLEDVANDVVLEGAVEQVVALEVEAPPLQSRLGGPLEKRPGRVAEELGHVHALGAARRRLGRGCAGARRRAVEEVREELVEEAAAAAEPA